MKITKIDLPQFQAHFNRDLYTRPLYPISNAFRLNCKRIAALELQLAKRNIHTGTHKNEI